MRPFLAILAFSAVALAGPVLAAPGDDEVIATAQAKPTAQALTATAPATPAVAPSRPMTTQEQIAAFIATNPATELDDGPRGLVPADRDEDGKRKIHGSMGVSVGTGGYRSAYASALIPVGENTTVGVAVSKTDFGKRGGGWYGDSSYYGGGYGGYGYGPGYGYGRARGGERQSVALSVMSSGFGGRGADDAPEGCAPGFRDGGRYVEPLWVEGMRDGAHPCSAAADRR